MRSIPLLFTVALALSGCAADDGFRARLAEGCHSERECAQLARQADARAGTCPGSANPHVVIRVHLDLGSSAPPCDEVEEDQRVAHGYLDGYARAREQKAAQQKEARREEKRARRAAEQEKRRDADEAEQQRRAAIDAELRQREEARLEVERRDAQERAEREERARAARESAAAPRSTPVVPATPAPRDTGGHVCCCDGSVSPTCTTVHRGCCSHHGGVCSCD